MRAIQLLVDGLRFGLLIAICAVGLSLIYGTTGLTNFAHGELVTIGAVAAWYINVRGGVPLIPAALIAMIVGAAVGALNERYNATSPSTALSLNTRTVNVCSVSPGGKISVPFVAR